jgi:hypothetical protein
LLSTATASAETSEPAHQDIVTPVVDTLVQQKPRQVQDIVQTVLPESPAPHAGLELAEVGKTVQGTVEQVTGKLDLPVPVPETELGHLGKPEVPVAPRLLTVDDRETGAQPVAHTIAANPQLAPAPTAGPERVAAHDDTRRAPVAESPRYAPPVGDAASALPALPRLPMPMPMPLPPAPTAPSSVCSACGNGGSNDDSGIAVAHSWPFPVSGLATSQALRLFSQHIVPAAGEQPGVTPD